MRAEDCTGASEHVHESIRRSKGGAIFPGAKADYQGQTFWAVCEPCHDKLTNPVGAFRVLALEHGWNQSGFRREVT